MSANSVHAALHRMSLMHGAQICGFWRAGPLLCHRRSRHARQSRQQGRVCRTASKGARSTVAMQLQVAQCCTSRPSSDVSLLCLGWQRASCLMMQCAMICRVWRGGRLRGMQVRRSCRVRQPQPAISAAGSATAAVSGLGHGNRRPSSGTCPVVRVELAQTQTLSIRPVSISGASCAVPEAAGGSGGGSRSTPANAAATRQPKLSL